MAARKYRRLSFAEKAAYARSSLPQHETWRCEKCKTQVEDRGRASHLERCWPAVLMALFVKVT